MKHVFHHFIYFRLKDAQLAARHQCPEPLLPGRVPELKSNLVPALELQVATKRVTHGIVTSCNGNISIQCLKNTCLISQKSNSCDLVAASASLQRSHLQGHQLGNKVHPHRRLVAGLERPVDKLPDQRCLARAGLAKEDHLAGFGPETKWSTEK